MLRRSVISCALVLLVGQVAFATSAGEEFFETKVRPVLAENCYKCHSAGAEKLKGGFRLDSRQGLLKGGESGEAGIVPGKPEESHLVLAIRYEEEGLKMPPKKKLAASEIADIEAWIKMGAPMPASAAVASTGPASTQPHALTIAEGRKFWSLMPVKDSAVPEASSQWAKNEVDRFVLAKLSEKNIAPSPMADRRTLIRRATYDLIGLPPTEKEVEEFAADQSPNAFEKVVDRLLASPHYGERWGRYWLDVARYADTKGYVFEEERRYAFSYTYRDWVVGALNADLPYDQFLVQQIAADRLPAGKDKSALAAMGFLTLGRRFLNVQADIIDDRIDVVMRGTMGLTVACARCHDHKYDPIPTADYYSLYGVFASSKEPEELPLIGGEKPKEYGDFEKELVKRRVELQTFLDAKHYERVAELRTAGRIAEYLLEAQKKLSAKEPAAAAEQFETVDDVKLNGFVLQRWQDFLSAAKTKDDPVFAPWRAACVKSTTKPTNANPLIVTALAGKTSIKDVAQKYGEVLAKHLWVGAQSSDAERELHHVLVVEGGPTTFKREESSVLLNRADNNQHRQLKQAIDTLVATHAGSPSRAMALEDLPTPVEPKIFVRGNSGTPGKQVPWQFLAVLSPEKREPFKDGSGRLELAKLVASKENPLTARVMVNRVWMHHFGFGLVRTPSDFGTRGERPTHPELLDWLAKRFMDDGWSLKKLHKRMMLSSAYQQSSEDRNPAARQVDPENKLLWRQNSRRLDLEGLRDSLLMASGQLDMQMGGRSVDMFAQPFTMRRTIYGFIDRQNLPGLFRTFDFASPDSTNAQRFDTTVPQQALFMMNSPFVVEQVRKLVTKPEIANEEDPRQRIALVYQAVLQRNPTKEEADVALNYIDSEEQTPTVAVAERPLPWR